MLDIVKTGKSPHVVTGERIFKLAPALIEKENKVVGLLRDPEQIAELRRVHVPEILELPFYPRTMSVRQASKKSVHGLNYDEGYKMFALMNEIDEREAKRIVELYKRRAFPGLPVWHASIDETISKTRVLENCLGRRCYFMGPKDRETFKKGYAFIPQSTVADSCFEGMVAALDDDTPDFAPAALSAQVHDSLLFDYRSRDFEAMARFAIKVGLTYMRPVLSYHGESFQLGVDLKAGLSWGRLKEVPLTTDVGALASGLEKVYRELTTRKEAA